MCLQHIYSPIIQSLKVSLGFYRSPPHPILILGSSSPPQQLLLTTNLKNKSQRCLSASTINSFKCKLVSPGGANNECSITGLLFQLCSFRWSGTVWRRLEKTRSHLLTCRKWGPRVIPSESRSPLFPRLTSSVCTSALISRTRGQTNRCGSSAE